MCKLRREECSHDPDADEQFGQSRCLEAPNGRQGIKEEAPSYDFVVCHSCRVSIFCFQANKIIEHRRKYERKREEKEIKEKQERIKKAREEHARAQRVSSCLEKYNGPLS